MNAAATPRTTEAPVRLDAQRHLSQVLLPRRRVKGVLVGVLLAAVVYAATASGALGWFVPWLLVGGLLVGVPTSPEFSRRVALNGCLVIGWIPVLWWVPVPFDLNHSALVLATVSGAVISVAASAASPAQRIRGFVPTFRRGDLLVITSGIIAVAAVYKLAFARSPTRALSLILPGADNYVHYNLFSAMRAHGSTLDVAATPADGSAWAYESYPAAFHAILASISEITHPRLNQGSESLVAYVQGLALVVVIGLIIVTAAILSLPGLRDRPGVAAPAVVIVWAAFLWEPGQKALANGFGNFWLGALAAGTALILSIAPRRPHGLVDAVAVSGLLVLIAHTWTPLLVPGAPAALLLLFDRDPELSARENRLRSVRSLGVFIVAGLAILKAAMVLLATVDVKFLVTAFGGLNGTSPLPTFILIVGAFYLCLSYPAWIARRGDGGDLRTGRRVRRLVLVPALAVALAGVLFAAQMRSLGTTSYYFLKYLMGIELILGILVPGVAAMLLAHVTAPLLRRTGTVLSVVGCLFASQFFGLIPGRSWLLLSETDGGTASVSGRYSRDGLAQGIVDAADHSTPLSSARLEYLALGNAGAAEAFYPDGWYHAVNATLTNEGMGRLAVLRTRIDNVSAAVPVTRRLLASDPGIRILVSPTYLMALRNALPTNEARRVVSW